MSPEYLVHQARSFHTTAVEQINAHHPGGLANLAIAVEYLIKLAEQQQGGSA